ncbi:hypothetical protein ATO11_05345 [Pseudaestuariivita atlantica]|uniref:Uncharacterized protein n=2 Tax=Pseudaestuariivita atlantica TaxID=1317121 RepID=A0A0L1JTG2_9RHOB|nr:hypothetical protein ATO11_05345 [Pseudaestuariivita atlantica]
MAQAQSGQNYVEPARGSADRAGMMDALRPHAEWVLGAPVEFLVHDLRQAGRTGFAAVTAQRPGGVPIDIRATPGFADGQLDPDFMDGTTLQALYRKSGETWVAVHWAIGATDVWYADVAFCAVWFEVLPEICR